MHASAAESWRCSFFSLVLATATAVPPMLPFPCFEIRVSCSSFPPRSFPDTRSRLGFRVPPLSFPPKLHIRSVRPLSSCFSGAPFPASALFIRRRAIRHFEQCVADYSSAIRVSFTAKMSAASSGGSKFSPLFLLVGMQFFHSGARRFFFLFSLVFSNAKRDCLLTCPPSWVTVRGVCYHYVLNLPLDDPLSPSPPSVRRSVLRMY